MNRKTTSDFVREAVSIYGDKYSYDAVEYVNSKTKVRIACHIHGDFMIRPNDHLRGQGCKLCGLKLRGILEKEKHASLFIKKSRRKHGDKYDYSKVVYSGAHEKVEIICSMHGSFSQEPNEHLKGSGCPRCSSSLGEEAISRYLEEKGLSFTREKNFDIDGLRRLRYDFYLPDKGILIEYNGAQHYRVVDWYGGVWRLLQQQIVDKKKRNMAEEMGLMLLEIPFWSYKKINDILDRYVTN